jgi:hypothetical protein
MRERRHAGTVAVRGLGIGAQKAGTTTLWQLLKQQPWFDAPSMKELNYFSTRYDLGEAWYRGQFPPTSPGRVTAEISPSYLRSPAAPGRAHRFDPTQRVFAILRDPVERAFSNFNMLRRNSKIDPSTTLLDLLRQPETDAAREGLLQSGEYATQLSAWMDLFGPDAVHVLFLEELVRDPEPVCRALFNHLGVDDAAIVPVTRETLPHANAARDVRSPTAKRFLRRIALRAANRGHSRTSVRISQVARLLDKDPGDFTGPKMSEQERAVLRDHYGMEVQRLASLLPRQLPW